MSAVVGQEHRVVGRDVDAVSAWILTLAPGTQEVAGAVEHHHRMLAAVEHIDVVTAVHADPADFLERPAVGQFRPIGAHSISVCATADDHSHTPSRGSTSLTESLYPR